LALCSRLSKLHSNVDPHPFSYTKRVIEEAFGRPLDQVFTELNPEPLGVGAIAQVYKARLRPDILLGHPEEQFALKNNVITSDSVQTSDSDGNPIILHTAVAIKVLHPKARQIVQRDLIIMNVVAKILTLIPTIHWLSLPDEVRVFGEMMKEQLDLRGEARNLERFNEYFRDQYDVKFPKPLVAFSTRDMLLEEYERGIPLDIFLNQAYLARKNDVEGVYEQKMANVGLNAFLVRDIYQ
jgi:aarF domain-containing kinase